MSEQQPQPPHPWMIAMGFRYQEIEWTGCRTPGEDVPPACFWLLGDELGPDSISCGLDDAGNVENWQLGELCIEGIGTRDTIALLALAIGLITYEKFKEIYNQ